jgi:hypothetical protein
MVGITVTTGILLLLGGYGLAFALIVFSIVNGFGAVVRAIVNPSWYAKKRAEAGLETDLSNPRKGIQSLVITKLIVGVPLMIFAWYLGEKAGYL